MNMNISLSSIKLLLLLFHFFFKKIRKLIDLKENEPKDS